MTMTHTPTGPDAPPPRDWRRIALWLVATTQVYNIVEAGIALWAAAAASSIALLGFGLDSLIETAAAGAMLYHLWWETQGRDPEQIEGRERTVHRFVGVTLLLLALYVVGQSAWTLWRREAATESIVGIVLAAASLVIMPVVSWYKLRAARAVGSRALAAEAKETLACSYLSFCLLAGLLANAVAGWWWADPLAALLMVPWLAHEGLEGFEEEEEEA